VTAVTVVHASVLASAFLAMLATPSTPRTPDTLRDTGFDELARRPFVPQYALWSDGAAKSRWVFLPTGRSIDASDEHDWNLPEGTRLWKEFRVDGRKVETRFIWKASAERWVFASYAWNAAGTEARLAPEQGMTTTLDGALSRPYRIPAVSDCQACHGGKTPRSLGFTALQLSDDRDPGAVHAEPPAAGMLTLATLAAEGAFGPASMRMNRRPRIQASTANGRSALGYLMTNCGSCHDGSGEIATPGLAVRQADLVRDGDAVARALVDRTTTWQRPGASPDESTFLLDSRTPHESAILLRMRSRRPSSQMPPLGTAIRDDAALALIERWIGDVTQRTPDAVVRTDP
jgi:cytochrome c553